MCNLYEYDMTPEVMQTLKDHFRQVGSAYLEVLRKRASRGAAYRRFSRGSDKGPRTRRS